jgi:ferritin-like metal-binding protein YciE
VDALPKIADAASSTELKQAFTHHLEETKKHVMRLDDVFRILEEDPKGETCEAMKGRVKRAKK